MADIQFQCSHCGGDLTVDQEGAGLEVECPSCLFRIVIPDGKPPVLTSSAKPASKSNRLSWILVFFVLSAITIGFILAIKFYHKKFDPKNNKTIELVDSKWKSLGDLKSDAEKGDAEAQFFFGGHYQFGDGVATNLTEAVKWYQKAAEQGYAPAQSLLGGCYYSGNGVSKDYNEAVKWYSKAAEQGDGPSELYLGLCYYYGNGVSKDYVEAHKWVSLSLMQGFTDGNKVLAQLEPLMSQEQLGRAKEAAENLFVLRNIKAKAENGDATAQYILGADYKSGALGLGINEAEAMKWFSKAANQGFALAQFSLGLCYANGQGVTQDYGEMVKWYRKAADQGVAEAQFNLGVCYGDGQGVTQDYKEAVRWYRKAANQGVAEAQFNLGNRYAKGEGVTQNDLEAYIWASLAAAQGNKNASKNRDIFAKRMSREEISEGQRRAAAFVPRKETAGSSSDNSTSPENPTATGTGFFITEDGYLISNYHVVKDATKVRLVTSAGLIDAKVVKVDAANDLALLKAEGGFPARPDPLGIEKQKALSVEGRFLPLPITTSRAVKLGGTVATVGFPDIGLQGFSPKLAKGEIASLSGAQDDARYFQISVPVQPGNSGGALVDAHGNVVGIVAAKLSARAALDATGALPENVNYAVKSSLLLSFLESVPDVSAKLKAPNTKERKFEDVVKSAQDAAVLVLVY